MHVTCHLWTIFTEILLVTNITLTNSAKHNLNILYIPCKQRIYKDCTSLLIFPSCHEVFRRRTLNGAVCSQPLILWPFVLYGWNTGLFCQREHSLFHGDKFIKFSGVENFIEWDWRCSFKRSE